LRSNATVRSGGPQVITDCLIVNESDRLDRVVPRGQRRSRLPAVSTWSERTRRRSRCR